MNLRLIPCTACQRHVRLGDPECPFCGAAMPLSRPLVAHHPGSRRLKSVAVVTFHAVALGAALSACGEAEDGASSDSDPRAGAAGAGGAAAGANAGGVIQPGTGGLPPDGGPTPIYRATPRG